MASKVETPNPVSATIPNLEDCLNQLRANGVIITPLVTTELWIVFTMCHHLNLIMSKSNDVKRIVTILNSLPQREADCFFNIICRLAFVHLQGHCLTNGELSNILLQNGYGSLGDLNLFGLINVSISTGTQQHVSLTYPHPDRDVQYFLAAIHLIRSPLQQIQAFISTSILHDGIHLNHPIFTSSVLRFMFGLAKTILGTGSSILLQNVLRYLALHLDIHVDANRTCGILILQCLYEAQEVTLYRQAQEEIFMQQVLRFESNIIEEDINAIAYYILNTTSKKSVWTIRASSNHPLMKKLDNLGVDYKPKPSCSDSRYNIVISKDDGVSVLPQHTTTLPLSSTNVVSGTYGFPSREQYQSNRIAKTTMSCSFRISMGQINDLIATRTQHRKNDRIRFSFPPTVRPDLFDCVQMTPIVPMHWIKVCEPDVKSIELEKQLKKKAHSYPEEVELVILHSNQIEVIRITPPSGSDPVVFHISNTEVTEPEVIECDYLMPPYHQNNDHYVSEWNQTNMFDMKDELVTSKLPIVTRNCGIQQAQRKPNQSFETSVLLLPSHHEGITRPPYNVNKKKVDSETLDESSISPVMVSDEDQWGSELHVVGGMCINLANDGESMTTTITTYCYDRIADPALNGDIRAFQDITPDFMVHPDGDDHIRYQFQQIPSLDDQVSNPNSLFLDDTGPISQNINGPPDIGSDNFPGPPGLCFYCNNNEAFLVGHKYPLPEHLPHTRILKNRNEATILEVYYEGTFYTVKKTTFRFRDMLIMPKLNHRNVVRLMSMMMGHPMEAYPRQRYMYQYFEKMTCTYDLRRCVGSYERYPPQYHTQLLSNIRFVMKEILSALNYLHTLPSPIVHRDVKPSSVLVKTNCSCNNPLICICKRRPLIVLSDFDACLELSADGKLMNDSAHSDSPRDNPQQPIYRISPAGTPGFQSPESFMYMISNSLDVLPPLSTKADIFSFGMLVVLLFMNVDGPRHMSQVGTLLLSIHQSVDEDGRLPQSMVEVLNRSGISPRERHFVVTEADVDSALPIKYLLERMELVEDISLELVAFVRRCLMVDPKQRPSAEDLLI